jgi:hypothetical protein
MADSSILPLRSFLYKSLNFDANNFIVSVNSLMVGSETMSQVPSLEIITVRRPGVRGLIIISSLSTMIGPSDGLLKLDRLSFVLVETPQATRIHFPLLLSTFGIVAMPTCG